MVGRIRGQATELSIERQEGDGFRISGYANRPVVDRFGEVVDVKAFEELLPRFQKNPIMLWMHNHAAPIGVWDQMELREDGLFVSGTIGQGFEPADQVRALIEQGVVKGLSIGFREIEGGREEDGVYHIRKLDLYEISVVSVPANQEAIFEFDAEDSSLKSIEIIKDHLEEDDLDALGVIGYRKYPTQEPGTPWSASQARVALRTWATSGESVAYSRYAVGFTYVEAGSEDHLTAYCLPHHTVVNGVVVTSLRGCRAVIAALAGVQGGVNIPADAKQAIYAHVARHITADFNAEVPPLDALRALDEETLCARLDVTPEEVSTLTWISPPGTKAEQAEPQPAVPADLIERLDRMESRQADIVASIIALMEDRAEQLQRGAAGSTLRGGGNGTGV